MATSYTNILKLALPATGELAGTWGDVVNQNITSMIEEAIAGLATIDTWAAGSRTLTVSNGTTSESRCAILDLAGAPGQAATVICPDETKIYIVRNGVSGGFAATIKTASGTGVTIPNGKTAAVFCDGVNVRQATDFFATVDIDGGTIDGTTIGATSASTGAFTTLTSSGATTLNGTTIPASATLTKTTDKLNVFAATTSAELAGVISDETGTGALVFGTNPTISGATTTGGTINNTPIGGTTPSTVASTNLSYTGTLTGGTGVVNLGSGQFYKDASGNVGIGTSSPTESLTISGNLSFALIGNGQSVIRAADRVSENADDLLIRAGNVTGGGSWLGRTLTLQGGRANLNSAGGLVDIRGGEAPGTGNGGEIRLSGGASTSGNGGIVSIYTQPSSGSLTERMRIDSSGNVGIGTSSPGLFRLKITADSNVNVAGILMEDTNVGGREYVIASSVSTVGSLDFRDQTAGVTRMTITSAGNVGIGTSSPANLLDIRFDVSGSNANGLTISNDNNSGWGGSLNFVHAAGGVTTKALRSFISSEGGTAGSFLRLATASGTSAPVERMRITADGTIIFNAYGAGTLSTNASGVISASDGRYKTKTRSVENGLDAIAALQPTYFKWDEDSLFASENEELGFIAQEVAAVIPEASPGEDEEGKFRNYYDRAIIAMLVKGMQELKSEVDSLKSQLEGN